MLKNTVDIIMMILGEINKDIKNCLSTIRPCESKNNEAIRFLESPLSYLIDILLNLVQKKKIGFFKDFINREVIYILTQVHIILIFTFLLKCCLFYI